MLIQRRLTLLALATVIGAGFTTAFGADPASAPAYYNVEIVVFRATSPLGVAEDWKAEAAIKNPVATEEDSASEADTATSGAQVRLSFQPLSSSHFKLSGTDAALRRSAGYEVLAHVAWTQPTTPYGGNSGVPLTSVGVGDQTLHGQVGLEQGRYLHLNLDLSWTPANPPSSLLAITDGQGPVTFTLKQKRRVRPFEQHYFDHPAFGVIAIVTPASPAAQ